MLAPPRFADEPDRLTALERSGALGAGHILGLQDVAKAAACAAGVPIGLVTFIAAAHQWVKASVGIEIEDVDRDMAFCAWAVHNAEVLWIEDALEDPRFFDNPLVVGEPHIRHYAGAPIITPEGYALGAVCVIDNLPRAYDPAVAPELRRLADAVSQTLHHASAPWRSRAA